jgi:hypothetical protein
MLFLFVIIDTIGHFNVMHEKFKEICDFVLLVIIHLSRKKDIDQGYFD